MEQLVSDLRYAVRTLRRNPVFTAVAVLSLALGIGVNVLIFSVVNSALEKPVSGVADSERLMRVYRGSHSPLAYQDFRYFRDSLRSMEGMVAERLQAVTTDRGGEVVPLQAAAVPDDYFRVLGVRAAAGRTFGPEDRGGDAVVVLSHDYWASQLGADPNVVGTVMRLNGQPYTVVGVANPAFTSSVPLWKPRVYVPFSVARPVLGVDANAWNGSVYVTARLREAVDRQTAQAELDVRTRQLIASRAGPRDSMTVRLDAARGVIAEIRRPAVAVSAFLMVVVGLVLLIACANVANLLLARASARRREIGVRLAIGASRVRIVRQLLTESVLLALLGGAAAFVAAVQVARVMSASLSSSLPSDIAIDFSPDGRVLGYAIALSLLTAVLFGLAPALQSARRDLVTAIRDDSERSGYKRSRLRSTLVVGQVLLCTVLVAGSLLFLRSLGNARSIDPGFPTAGIVDVPLDLTTRQLDDEAGLSFYRRVVEETRAIPGVQSATAANVIPLSGSNNQTSTWIEGVTVGAGERLPLPYFNVIATDYFRTLGIPLVSGRDVGPTDTPASEPVAVINETMARQLWPAGSALGSRLSISGANGPWIRVVGIAADTKYNSLGEETPPFMYLPLTQNYTRSMVLHVKTAASVRATGESIGRIVRALDPQLPAVRATTLDADMQLALLPAKLGAALLGAFGSLALLLATVGIYGVASFAVARRTREIGIRAALGAQPRDVLRLVLGESMRRVGIGLTIGLAAALGVARLLASQLYGVGPVDPVAFTLTPAVLGGVAFLASWIPARRATRVDPLVALRGE